MSQLESIKAVQKSLEGASLRGWHRWRRNCTAWAQRRIHVSYMKTYVYYAGTAAEVDK